MFWSLRWRMGFSGHRHSEVICLVQDVCCGWLPVEALQSSRVYTWREDIPKATRRPVSTLKRYPATSAKPGKTLLPLKPWTSPSSHRDIKHLRAPTWKLTQDAPSSGSLSVSMDHGTKTSLLTSIDTHMCMYAYVFLVVLFGFLYTYDSHLPILSFFTFNVEAW